MFTAGVTLEVWRLPTSTTRDPFGNLPTARTLHHTEDAWALAPADQTDTAEPNEPGRDMTVNRWSGYREGLPTEIVASDEVHLGADVYEVVGKPGPWSDPWTGEFAGTELRLRMVNG